MMKHTNNELLLYETDNSNIKGTPSKIFFPESEDEIINLIKTTKQDIIPRGAGTNFVGSVVPNDSIIICTKKMKKVLDFNPQTKTIIAESGVTIKELNEKLKAIGFELHIYTNPESTLGGMIAMNTLSDLGRYGKIKKYLEEIEFINGRGELTKINKSDISDICGMEGTTGIITKAKIKINQIPKRSASIFQSDSIEEIITISKRLILDKEISSLKFYSPLSSKIIGLPEKNNLIIIFNSDRGKINNEEYKELTKKMQDSITKLNSHNYNQIEESEFVLNKLEDFIFYIGKTNIPFFGDFTSNTIYTLFRKDNKNQEEIKKIIRKMSGKPFLGIGLKNKKLIEPLRNKIIQRIKQRYDPFLRFNKGKIIDVVKKEAPNKETKKNEITNKEGLHLKADSLDKEKPNQFTLKSKEEEKDNLKNKLDDYKNTFQSEPNQESIKRIETISKNIPKEISSSNQSPIGKTTFLDNLERKTDLERETDNKIEPISKSDEDLIRNIMFNKTEKKEENKEDKNDKNRRT